MAERSQEPADGHEVFANQTIFPMLRPALVIPCHNDTSLLIRLLDRAVALGCFEEIIVVDDGSDIPVADDVDPCDGLLIIRNPKPLGGGIARNRGLQAVSSDYVLFFDADDLLMTELTNLLSDLALVETFDFCQFRYADSMVSNEGVWGQPGWDDRFWSETEAIVGALAVLPPQQWPTLAQTANYPWNKIYNTNFLRRNGIGCAATAVHQDIPLHWLGYLHAKRVLVSDRVCAWHEIRPNASRLTNRAGRARFEIFSALDPVATRVRGDVDWEVAFATFALPLFDWAMDRIDDNAKADFRREQNRWVSQWFAGSVDRIAARAPDLGQRILEQSR